MNAGLSGKRILIVQGALGMGGAERQSLHLARGLVERHGATVAFWGFGEPGAASDEADRLGIPWRSLGSPEPLLGRLSRPRGLAVLAGLARRLRQWRPDILLPYTLLPNTFVGALAPLSGAGLCIWNQRDGGVAAPPRRLRLERLALRHCARFISNSPDGRDYLRGLGVADAAISLIPNGVQMPPALEDRAGWRARLGLGEGDLLAGMLGNLHAGKDHQTLLLAWKDVQMRRSHPGRLVLALAGEPHEPHAAGLRRLVFQLGIGESVRFLGQVADVSGFLSACDLALFASEREGLPNGVLEPMALGLGVAATDLPGVRLALGEGAAGCLAPVGDAQALARVIRELVDDPERRRALGEANRARIRREFSVDRMVDRTAEVLVRLL